MNKTVIITGINGQLGQFMAKYLHENQPDIQVVGTIRHKSYDNQEYIFDTSKVIFELMDLSDAHSIENVILKYKPDYLINTAANAFVGESWQVPAQHFEINTLGVLHQLEAIRKHSPHTRYFNMGTSEEFACDQNDGSSHDENTKINPKSPYGASKAAARYIINIYRNSYNLYALQGWTFNFESELRGPKYVTRKVTMGVARIKKAIENNQPFEPIELGNLHSYRSWQFCGDVADGIWRMLNQDKYRIDIAKLIEEYDQTGKLLLPREINPAWFSILVKNIKPYVMSASNCHSIRELVEVAFKEAGIKIYPFHGLKKEWQYVTVVNQDFPNQVPVVVTNPKFYRPLDVTYLNGNSSLIQKELGWKPTLTFEQLIQRMVQHDLKNAS